MDYEKKYNEALDDMRVVYPNLKGDAKLAVEHAFPELAESEDERIRKKLYHTVLGTPDTSEWFEDIRKDAMLAWLKSLRPSWKPSEEQMESLNYAIAEWDGGKKLEGLYDLRNDLKKL